MPEDDAAAARRAAGGAPRYDVRHYLAEERTFLAWIRTDLGLIGVGLLMTRIDRFFLVVGAALIAIGAALSYLAVGRHRRVVDELNHPAAVRDHPSGLGIFLARLVAVAGIVMALYLILSR